MKKPSAKRSSLFLLELIIAILFFALASAVCVEVYVGARVRNRESAELSQAVLLCQNGAESLYSVLGTQPEPLAFLAGAVPDYHQEADGLALYFAQDWSPTAPDDAVFCLRLSLGSSDSTGLLSGTAEVRRVGTTTPLFSIPVTKYVS